MCPCPTRRGRRRRPATLPGYHAGTPPRNKRKRYPADPPTVDEIVAVMGHAPMTVTAGVCERSSSSCGAPGCACRRRSRWPSTLSTPGADRCWCAAAREGRRREIGMDEWGWEQLRPWLSARAQLRVGPLVCIIDGPTRRASVVGRRGPHRVSAGRRPGGRPTPVPAASATRRACARAGPRGRPAQHHPAPARAYQSRHHVDLSPGDRSGGDHHRRAHAPPADDVRQCRAAALIDGNAGTSGSAGSAPASPRAKQASARDPAMLARIVRSERHAQRHR
jgi:hypothetical protein